MNSNPFPGMNPWLESRWGDIHTRLTTYASDQLQTQLPVGLRARVEEYVAVESDDCPPHRFVPDVHVAETPFAPPTEPTLDAGVAIAEPVVVSRLVEPRTLRSIHIVDADSGNRVITSIEFLSPSNKVGEAGRKQYFAKQQKMLAGNVNIVEVDLLRTGSWVLAVRESVAPKNCRRPYRIHVVRASRPDQSELYPTSLREPLPTIRVPLRASDADVPLQLQALIDTAYLNGRYSEDIDYRANPDPPLEGADAEWVEQLLRERGLR